MLFLFSKELLNIYVMKYLIIIYTLLSLTFCKSATKAGEYEQTDFIKRIILSEEFSQNFYICKGSNEKVEVFNDTNQLEEFSFIDKNHCSKTISFKKINFEYNINSIHNNKKGIVLLSINNGDGWCLYNFVDLETNLNVILKYDDKQKLIDTKVGQF